MGPGRRGLRHLSPSQQSVCVCVREREKRRERQGLQVGRAGGEERASSNSSKACVCCMCVYISHTYVYVKILDIKTPEGARGLAEEGLRCFFHDQVQGTMYADRKPSVITRATVAGRIQHPTVARDTNLPSGREELVPSTPPQFLQDTKHSPSSSLSF